MSDVLTAEIARELLHYDPDTGILKWRHRALHWFTAQKYADRWNTRYAGNPVGRKDTQGYVQFNFYQRSYRSHRVIWLMMTGEWPKNEIDHIDHDQANNRWVNLRAVSSTENGRNRPKYCTNSSGVTGVNWHAQSGNWRAKVGNSYCAYFKDFDEAVAARRAAEIVLGYHENHGKTL